MDFSVDEVTQINRRVINAVDGIGGLIAGVDSGKLASALGRIDNLTLYEGLEDVFEIAAWYAIAIAKAHAFTDGNKRTGFVIALTFLQAEGFEIDPEDILEEVMVDVANSELNAKELANILFDLAGGLGIE